MALAWLALPALGADGALLSNSKRVDPHGRFPACPWALTRLFPGDVMVGDDRDIRNRVAQLRQIRFRRRPLAGGPELGKSTGPQRGNPTEIEQWCRQWSEDTEVVAV